MSSRAAADVDIRTSDFELLPLEIGALFYTLLYKLYCICLILRNSIMVKCKKMNRLVIVTVCSFFAADCGGGRDCGAQSPAVIV